MGKIGQYGICTEAEKEQCQGEFGEDGMAWACKKCSKAQIQDLGEYTVEIFKTYRLKQAGYPFKKTDLTIAQWLDIGKIREWEKTLSKSSLK